MTDFPPTITSDVSWCARCGEKHERVEFRKLTRPINCPDGAYQYWAPCPVSGEPLLLRRREGISAKVHGDTAER